MNTQYRSPEVAAALTLQSDFAQPNRGRGPDRATQADIRRAVAAVVQGGCPLVIGVLPSGVSRLLPALSQTIDNNGDSTLARGIVR